MDAASSLCVGVTTVVANIDSVVNDDEIVETKSIEIVVVTGVAVLRYESVREGELSS